MKQTPTTLLLSHAGILTLARPPLKGGCIEADPVAMWAGICFVAVVTVAYFFLNRRIGKR